MALEHMSFACSKAVAGKLFVSSEKTQRFSSASFWFEEISLRTEEQICTAILQAPYSG